MEYISLLEYSNFTIFCDSRSALQSLEVFNPDHPLVLKILQWLFLHQCRGNQISFCWVPAHVGVQGNERADQLAKEAARDMVPRQCSIPYRDFFTEISWKIKHIWQQQWDNVGRNKMKEITSNIKPWTYYMMPRKWEVILCRLRIGHTRVTHGYLMSGENEPYCDDCLVPKTVKHLLVECPSLRELRYRYFLNCRENDGNFSLGKILGEDFSRGIFSFLSEAGLLDQI